jgi:hypothetical protein
MRILRANEALRLVVRVVACVMIAATAACRNPPNEVLFYSGDSVKQKPSDLSVNALRQFAALRRAEPERDAAVAFSLGDLRLIGDTPAMTRFLGVPDDDVVRSLSGPKGRYGFKVIAFNDTLLENREFLDLKVRYETLYNARMYQLVNASASTQPKGTGGNRLTNH